MPAIAITRGIPSTFANAVVQHPATVPIDVEAARREHATYVRALGELGFQVNELPPDDAHPDCCFVEDVALVHEGMALLCRVGAPSRRGEGEALREVLGRHARIETMEAPATLEGGDCLRIGKRLYVGRSARTNDAGIERAREVFGPLGLEIVTVPMTDALHLKSVCSSPGRGRVLLAEGTVPPATFEGTLPIVVPREEAHASNCVVLDEVALIPEGCPRTRQALESAGFRVRTIDNQNLRKADGALTCLSIRLGIRE
jgi:dimethylargininase